MKNVNKYLLIPLLLIIIYSGIEFCTLQRDVNIPIIRRRLNGKNNEEISERYEHILPDDLSHLTDVNSVNSSIGMDALIAECICAIRGESGAVIGFLLLCLSLTAIAAVCGALCSDISPYATRCLALVALITIVTRLMPMVGEVAEVLEKLSGFLLALIPILSSISTSLGHVAVATSQSTAMSLTLSLFGGEGATLLVTIVKYLLLLAVLSAFTKEGTRLASTLKSVFMWGLGIITTLLSGIISVQTLISRGADNATMAATKYAISNMLPIAGGAVSGALSTLVGGMSHYAALVGGGAVAVVVLTVISPLVSLLMYKLALSVVSLFVSFIGADALIDGVKSVSGALDALIGLYAVTIVVYVLEIMLFLHQVVV